VASGPPGERVASYTCRKKRASGVCSAPATARIDAVDALVLPELETRSNTVDLEAALVELYDAQVAFGAADRELEEFLAGARISDLGADVYNREVARRRETLRQAATAYREALDAQDAMASTDADDMTEQRELARRLIESVTLKKSSAGGGSRSRTESASGGASGAHGQRPSSTFTSGGDSTEDQCSTHPSAYKLQPVHRLTSGECGSREGATCLALGIARTTVRQLSLGVKKQSSPVDRCCARGGRVRGRWL
jgi:hypothetical protein